MISINKTPPDTILSRQPAWFEISSWVEGSNRIKADVSCEGSLIGSLYSFTSIDDVASFELSELIHHPFTRHILFHAAPDGNNVDNISNDVKKTIDITFSNDNGEQVSTSIVALNGALTSDMFDLAKYGSHYDTIHDYLSQSPILSFKPDNIYVYHHLQPERLYFYAAYDRSITIEAVIYFSNGDTVTNVIASISAKKGNVYLINTSYDNIVTPHSDGPRAQASLYTIAVYESSFRISPRYYYRVNLNTHTTGSFVFQNSLGGYDTFCPTGELSVNSSRSHNTSNIVAIPGDKQPSLHVSQINTNTVYTQNTGFLSHDYSKWLPQMLFSPSPYWIPHVDEGYAEPIPISFADGNIKTVAKKGALINAEIPYFFNPFIKAEQIIK